jgi:hypothetical protein
MEVRVDPDRLALLLGDGLLGLGRLYGNRR